MITARNLLINRLPQSGADTYVDSVFSSDLYTGTFSDKQIVTGIDMSGQQGMVWLRRRDATSPVVADTVRGANHIFKTTQAAIDSLTSGTISFLSNGFSVGASADTNYTSKNYTALSFRRAAKFFDVVSYVGNGGTKAIPHSLGVSPGLIIVKSTSRTSAFSVYHASASGDLLLGPTVQGSSLSQISSVSNTSFSAIGLLTNSPGASYVAYLFANDTDSSGIIKCGSLTLSSGAGLVDLGWSPQVLITKGLNIETDWIVDDISRGWSASTRNALSFCSSTAEVNMSPNTTLIPTSSGFRILGGYGSSSNIAYIAIRKGA